jgi:hypothetical protein
MERLLGILGWTFALLSFDLVLSIILCNLAFLFIGIFIEVVCGFAYALYLIQRINDPPPRVIRYSKCYKGYRGNEI